MKIDVKQALSYIGLKPDTASTYLACLAMGGGSASDIAKKAKLPRTVVYSHLEELEEHGLITASIQGGAKKFLALDPNVILSLAEQQKNELQAVLPFLSEQFAGAGSGRPKLRFYTDILGLKTFMEEVLACRDKAYRILGAFSDDDLKRTFGQDWMVDWSMRRIARGVSHRSLRPLSAKSKIGRAPDIVAKAGPQYLREMRYVPNSVKLPILIYLFDGKVGFFSARLGNVYVAVLESKDVYDALVSLFETLWTISEPG